VQEGAGQREEAVKEFTAALAVMQRLATDFPACPNFRRQVAASHMTLGRMYLTQHRFDEAEVALRQSIELWKKVVASFPDIWELQAQEGKAYQYLAMVLVDRDRIPQAVEVYDAALRLHEKLVADHPKEAELHAVLGGAHAWFGQLYENQKRPTEAVAHYAKSIAILEAGWQLDPRRLDILRDLCNTLRHQASLLLSTGRSGEYEEHLRRAQTLEQKLEPAVLRLGRMRRLLEEGKTAPALEEAEEVYQGDGLSGPEWRELAAIFASAMAQPSRTPPGLLQSNENVRMFLDSRHKDQLGGRAVAALRKSLECGFPQVTPLADDPAFRVLATRPDFQSLSGAQRK
jgi:tetratricopeptide (TPR) repeat protein